MSIAKPRLRITRVIIDATRGCPATAEEKLTPTVPAQQYVYTIGSFCNSPITVISDRPVGSFASSRASSADTESPAVSTPELAGGGHKHTHGSYGGPARQATYSRRPGFYQR